MSTRETEKQGLHHQPAQRARRESAANAQRSKAFPQGEFSSPEDVKSLGGPRPMETIGWGSGEDHHRGRQENRDGGMIGAGVLAGRRRLRLKNGYSLRLLTAMEVLEARREAESLARENRERALCSNACLLARALEYRGKAVYPDGETVLCQLQVEEIGDLARRWGTFNRAENPSVLDGEGVVDALKKAWSTRPTNA